MAALKEPCGNCGAIIDRRTDGYGIDPEKGLLCVRCWKLDHAENGHTQTPWEILTFVTDPNHILIGKGFDVIARLDKDDPLAEGNARLILRDVNVHEDLVAALKAIVARINGVWDDPDLMAFGPLLTESADVEQIAKLAIAKTRKEG